MDTATEVKTGPVEEIVVEKEPEIKAEDAFKVAAEVLTEASPEEIVKTAVEASPGVAPEASGDVAAKPEDAPSKAEAGTPAAPSEELVDPAPVAADAVEAWAETNVVETPEGTPHILYSVSFSGSVTSQKHISLTIYSTHLFMAAVGLLLHKGFAQMALQLLIFNMHLH